MLLSKTLNNNFVFVMNLTNTVNRFNISFGGSNPRRRVPAEHVWCLVLVQKKISDYFYSLNA